MSLIRDVKKEYKIEKAIQKHKDELKGRKKRNAAAEVDSFGTDFE